MPIQTGSKGASLFGSTYPPYCYIDWFSPAEEALALQGGDAVRVPRRRLTAGQEDAVVGLVQRGRGGPVEVVNPVAGGHNAPGGASTTFQQVIAVRGPAYAVRATYYNQVETGGYTVTSTNIAPSSVYNPRGNASGAPKKIQWSGADSCTVPAAPAAGMVAYGTPSDWTPISPLAWTEAPAVPYTLWHVRSFMAAAGYPFLAVNGANFANYSGNAVGGLVRFGTLRGMDWIDTYGPPAAYDGLSDGLFMPLVLEFRTLSSMQRVLYFGDSIANGVIALGGGQLASFAERACNIANGDARTASIGRLFCASNHGVGSQTFEQIYGRLPAALTSVAGEVVLLPVFSPNSPRSTQAAVDADVARVLDGIARVRAVGATPVLYTGSPYPGMSVAQDGFRKAINSLFLNYCSATGLLVADLDAVVSAGGSPANWKPGYSNDALHPSDVATAAMASVLAGQLLLT